MPVRSFDTPMHSARMGTRKLSLPPPNLSSDTVVFQAAKIPLSSSRLATTPRAMTSPSPSTASNTSSFKPQQTQEPTRRMTIENDRNRNNNSPLEYDETSASRSRRAATNTTNGSGQASPVGGSRSYGGRLQPSESSESFTSLLSEPLDATSMKTKGNEAPTRTTSHENPNNNDAASPKSNDDSINNTSQSSSSNTNTNTNDPDGTGKQRFTVRVMKDGDKLGFGIRHDHLRRLKVSTLQNNSNAALSSLRIGDTIVSVNGTNLTDLGFLEVIQQLKATKPGELVFEIERTNESEADMRRFIQQEERKGTASMYPSADLDALSDTPRMASRTPSPTTAPSTRQTSPYSQSQSYPEPSAPPPPVSHHAPPRRPSPPLPTTVSRQPSPLPSRNDSMVPSPSHATHTTLPSLRRPSPAEYNNSAMRSGPSPLHSSGASTPTLNPPLPSLNQHHQHSQMMDGSRKRMRTQADMDVEWRRLEKNHKQVVHSMALDLKKERAERSSLEEKNAALRKRLQKMLIECDEVQVKAQQTVNAVKESATREIQQLEKALAAARAQLRLSDRSPNFAAHDQLIKELDSYKHQLDRMRKMEVDRNQYLKNRFATDARHAEREAYRTREKLISMFRVELRQVYKRTSNGGAGGASGSSGSAFGSTGNPKSAHNNCVMVMFDGLRRLAFLKLFGLPCDLESYMSNEFISGAQVRHCLQHDEMIEIFGNALGYEERAGYYVMAVGPMDLVYDPALERLNIVCSWSEQNTIREMARNVRF